MAHKKGAGSTKNGRDSRSKRLGVKIYGGQKVKVGNILVQRSLLLLEMWDFLYKGAKMMLVTGWQCFTMKC